MPHPNIPASVSVHQWVLVWECPNLEESVPLATAAEAVAGRTLRFDRDAR
jgi:hypothetical protein